MKKKIDCKECVRTCCDGIRLEKKIKGEIDPKEVPVGGWIYTHGITFVKKKNGLFKCRAFDSRKRLCRIWNYRPPICREFFCKYSNKKKRKRILNKKVVDNIFDIYFEISSENPIKDLKKKK